MSEEASHDPTPERPSKRARTDASKQNASKKRVKGRQGGLQGIMKMPIEVFMEIAPYVDPGDLIVLIRTNKFFRAMLLDRSAAPIWQRSLDNVPDLPPCPTGMVEPQYAALIFSKNCTICGAQAIASKPDPYLRVRLCPSCRDTELVERSSTFYSMYGSYVPYTLLIKKTKKSMFKNPAYQLRTQTDELERARSEFLLNDDQEGLSKWKQEQQEACETLRKARDELLQYINFVAASRSTELRDLKTERRDQIQERLRALGWDEKYFSFWRRSNNIRKQWHTLVDAPKPLTERTWTTMLPKLIQLLEENRPEVDEFERKQRLTRRRSKVNDLLLAFERNADPYQPIVDALLNPSASALSKDSFREKQSFRAPFPSDKTLNSWDFLFEMYKEENDLERVGGLFDEQRGMLGQKLLEWRTEIESQLVRQYTSSFAEGSSLNTALTVKGSTDATRDLADHTRFLLRADTVFTETDGTTCNTEVDQEHGPVGKSIHFPHIFSLQNYPYLYEYSSRPDPDKVSERLEPYARHKGKEAIARALLKELNMPDAAHIELERMGEVFVCGRCTRQDATGWHEIVSNTLLLSTLALSLLAG
ncbi:unnamed protein product [Rhizoctonia solani]|uniref:F-box domain-containing protein n=1 Tax=Rhizoctonia solani TaxID=456999 RepID=A0A8H3GNK3_9AGAM|nr:unnamed protein product [Rhizoctonia solani]